MSGSPGNEATGSLKAAARMSSSSAGGLVSFPGETVGYLSGMGVSRASVVPGPLAHSSRVPCLGIVPSRTGLLVKVVRGLIACLISWIGLFCPILQGLCIHQGFLQMFFPVVLAWNHWIQDWQECLLADALQGRW